MDLQPLASQDRLTMAVAVCSFLHDFRASYKPAQFVFGFWFAFLWLATAVQVILTWPTGRLVGRGLHALAAACYLISISRFTSAISASSGDSLRVYERSSHSARTWRITAFL